MLTAGPGVSRWLMGHWNTLCTAPPPRLPCSKLERRASWECGTPGKGPPSIRCVLKHLALLTWRETPQPLLTVGGDRPLPDVFTKTLRFWMKRWVVTWLVCREHPSWMWWLLTLERLRALRKFVLGQQEEHRCMKRGAAKYKSSPCRAPPRETSPWHQGTSGSERSGQCSLC